MSSIHLGRLWGAPDTCNYYDTASCRRFPLMYLTLSPFFANSDDGPERAERTRSAQLADRNGSGAPPGTRSGSASPPASRTCRYRSWSVIQKFHLLRELAERGFEHVSGNRPQPAHGRIEYPSFQTADVSAVEAAIGAEAFLRMARLFAEFAHDDSDGFSPSDRSAGFAFGAVAWAQIRWW